MSDVRGSFASLQFIKTETFNPSCMPATTLVVEVFTLLGQSWGPEKWLPQLRLLCDSNLDCVNPVLPLCYAALINNKISPLGLCFTDPELDLKSPSLYNYFLPGLLEHWNGNEASTVAGNDIWKVTIFFNSFFWKSSWLITGENFQVIKGMQWKGKAMHHKTCFASW